MSTTLIFVFAMIGAYVSSKYFITAIVLILALINKNIRLSVFFAALSDHAMEKGNRGLERYGLIRQEDYFNYNKVFYTVDTIIQNKKSSDLAVKILLTHKSNNK